MHRRIKVYLLLVFSLLVFSHPAFAVILNGTLGAATKYEVRLEKFELYNSITGTWITAYEGLSSILDIASGTSGEAVGDFLSGVTVPDGVYTKAKVTPAPSFTISGTIAGYHTTSDTIDDGSGRTASVASNTGTEEDCAVQILESDVEGVGVVVQDFSATPITVTDGVADHKIRVYFDVSTTLDLTGPPGFEFIFPMPPTVTIEII